MKDGFLKAAALSPALRVADCAYNVRQYDEALRKAAARGVKLAVFPEFCLTGYTCGDLFLHLIHHPADQTVQHPDQKTSDQKYNDPEYVLRPVCPSLSVVG